MIILPNPMTSLTSLKYEAPNSLFQNFEGNPNWISTHTAFGETVPSFFLPGVANLVDFLRYFFYFYNGDFLAFYKAMDNRTDAPDKNPKYLSKTNLWYMMETYQDYKLFHAKDNWKSFFPTFWERFDNVNDLFRYYESVTLYFHHEITEDSHSEWTNEINLKWWTKFSEFTEDQEQAFLDQVKGIREHIGAKPFLHVIQIKADPLTSVDEVEEEKFVEKPIQLSTDDRVNELGHYEQLLTLPLPPSEQESKELNDYFENAPNIQREPVYLDLKSF